ncbi:DUF2071 domain-containing protein [Natrinema sp. CBA1119]|uniref:DUF2071 domain-containing protein n=1 Tax=Natrinema sp. CBA1119 TaxID=1608465 RepID=UPI0020D28A14|nr:DUF2071 domain-containing protein [Natrinema sp. CBA1119]
MESYACISLDVEAAPESEGADGQIRFSSRRRHPGPRPATYEAAYRLIDELFLAPDGSVRYTDVEQEPWPLCPATADIEMNTVLAADGFAHPESEPVYFYSSH